MRPTAAATAKSRPTQPPSPKKAGEESVSPKLAAAPAVPVGGSGSWEQLKALGHYLTKTEVHTYAFSVAAQAILSLFPFIVLLLTISQRVFHSSHMTEVVGDMMSNFLPNNQDFVMRNMRSLAFTHAPIKIFSIVMLLITATGVFLPLEVALNSVWGVKKNRSYLRNQIVAIGLAIGVALLAMASVALSAAQRTVLDWIFMGNTKGRLFALAAEALSPDRRPRRSQRSLFPHLLGASRTARFRRWPSCALRS